MKMVIQRVSEASVMVNDAVVGAIKHGLMVLVGIEDTDTAEDVIWLSGKLLQMRIFNDEAGLMNLSVKDVGGSILLISQFTLHASTKKGNRPSFIQAAKPPVAIPLYEALVENLRAHITVATGIFGADMKVALINDGPVTIVIDSKHRI
ncbi:MAG TPA: D-tyrosyl-tRNA(Tyr) deacylase [Chitinophagaceae bacterium]|nr:D-tyrosyl-tRNA(Tyr) deacylase [Chitinophagaceae bacterium]